MNDEIVEVNDRQLRTASDFYDVVHIFRHALILVLLVRKAHDRPPPRQDENKVAVDLPNVEKQPQQSEAPIMVVEDSHQVRIQLEPPGMMMMAATQAEHRSRSSSTSLHRNRLESIINQLSDEDDEYRQGNVQKKPVYQRKPASKSSQEVVEYNNNNYYNSNENK